MTTSTTLAASPFRSVPAFIMAKPMPLGQLIQTTADPGNLHPSIE